MGMRWPFKGGDGAHARRGLESSRVGGGRAGRPAVGCGGFCFVEPGRRDRPVGYTFAGCCSQRIGKPAPARALPFASSRRRGRSLQSCLRAPLSQLCSAWPEP